MDNLSVDHLLGIKYLKKSDLAGPYNEYILV